MSQWLRRRKLGDANDCNGGTIAIDGAWMRSRMLSMRTNGGMMVMLLIRRASSGEDPCEESRRMVAKILLELDRDLRDNDGTTCAVTV